MYNGTVKSKWGPLLLIVFTVKRYSCSEDFRRPTRRVSDVVGQKVEGRGQLQEIKENKRTYHSTGTLTRRHGEEKDKDKKGKDRTARSWSMLGCGSHQGHLWCHEGEKILYSPTQCPAQTLECFKFTCESGDNSFVARGCGVSLLTTAVGLPNESCHQALDVCQRVGGSGVCEVCNNKHMCNSIKPLLLIPPLLLACFAML